MIWSADDLSQPTLTFQAELADTVSWTPDSQYLIIEGVKAQDDGHSQMSVEKWDATTGELVDTLMSFQLSTSFEFNPYGYYVFPNLALDSTKTKAAFSFRNGVVFVSDGSQVLHLENDATTNNVYLMDWSPDDRDLAVVYGSSDIYRILVFNVESGELIEIISQDYQYHVTDIGWDATGTYLATSSRRYTCCEGWSNVGVYHIEDDDVSYIHADYWWDEVAYHDAPIDWHPTEFILAIAHTDAIKVYDPPKAETALFTIPIDEARDIEWSPDGTQIAGVSSDGALAIGDVDWD